MKKPYLILGAGLMIFLAGCHRNAPNSAETSGDNADKKHIVWVPKGAWQKYSAPNGKYSVMLPGTPVATKDYQPVGNQLYEENSANLYIDEQPGHTCYIVSDIQWKGADIERVGREHFLDEIYARVTQPIYRKRIKERRKIWFRSMEMDEIELTPDPFGKITIIRNVLAGEYQVTLFALFDPQTKRPDADQFFNSLIVNP